MPFFFQTSNASVSYRAKAKDDVFEFTFEPVEVVAGAWRGVLQVVTEQEADALRSIKGPVSEVSAEEYADLKKKWFPNSRPLKHSVEPLPQTLHEAASSVAASPEADASTDTDDLAGDVVVGEPTAAEPVSLKLGTAEPPNDLAEDPTPAKKSRNKK